jgi:nucleoside-diphosphate-sugar epimerase
MHNDQCTMPTRLFVTGASGYVGRNVVRHFASRNVEVVARVRRGESARLMTLLGASTSVGDILDPDLAKAIEGCDALIHAAADTDHGRGGDRQRRVNEAGTRAVLEAARAAGVGTAVHISSDSVLADGRPLVDVDELYPYPRRPAGSYSRSKAAAERIALGENGRGMRVTVVRPRFVWGRDDTTALPALVAAARSGKLAWVAEGRYRTSTTHIANLCDGIELALRRGRGGESYFVADDVPVEFRGFVVDLLATQGIEAPDASVPRWLVRMLAGIGDAMGSLSGGRLTKPLTLQEYAASAVENTVDIGKARRELGYAPTMTRAEGMRELRDVSTSPV